MSGFGSLQRDVGGLGVAELADQDHIRVLTKDAAERLAEADRVQADLALVHDAAAIGMKDLDWILDRHDVLAARAVDVVEHGCKRRRLARAGRPGDEDQAAVLSRKALDTGWEPEIRE